MDPLDDPAGAVGLQQAGAHAGRDVGTGDDPRLVRPYSIATATAAPTAPQMDVACRPRSKNTELRSSLSWPGAVFKNGKLIERPDESQGGDQQVV